MPASSGVRIGIWIKRLCASLIAIIVLLIAACLSLPRPWWAEEAGSPPSLFSYPRSLGTGFFAAPNGWLLTNAHVTLGCRRVTVGNFRLSGLVADRVLYPVDRQIDLAAVHVALRSPRFLRFVITPWPAPTSSRDELQRDLHLLRSAGRQAVSVIGFPGYDHGARPVRLPGELVGATTADRQHWFLKIDAPVRPGSSGSAVVNTRGEVLGIMFRATVDLPVQSPAASLKAALTALPHSAAQGSAVSAAVADAFMRAADPLGGNQGGGDLSDPDESIVRIFCWR